MNTKPLIIIGLSVILGGVVVYAQNDTLWTKTYGGSYYDAANDVQQTDDGGFIIAGVTYPTFLDDGDAWLIRTDSDGNILWQKFFGGNHNDEPNAVQQTSDGGFIFVGVTKSFGAGGIDVWLVRTNSSGDTLWTRTFGGGADDYGNSLQQTGDGGFIIAGSTRSYGSGGYDVWLIKTNSSGNTLWSRTIGAGSTDIGRAVRQTSDGGYIITGQTGSYGAGSLDVWLIRTDSLGDTLWTRTFGESRIDNGYAVQQTADGGYAIAGYTYLVTPVWKSNEDLLFIKTDHTGSLTWIKTFGGSGADGAYSVQQTTDGGYIISGYTYSYGALAGHPDVWIVRTNSSGDTLWTQTFGGTGVETGNSVRQTIDGGYIVAGKTTSYGAGGYDAWLLRLNPGVSVHIDNLASLAPAYSLNQNYPNPFNPSTTIRFDLPEATEVHLAVYDLLGREVARLVDGQLQAGYHQQVWNGRDRNGNEVPTGIYFVLLVTPEFSKSIKIVLLK